MAEHTRTSMNWAEADTPCINVFNFSKWHTRVRVRAQTFAIRPLNFSAVSSKSSPFKLLVCHSRFVSSTVWRFCRVTRILIFSYTFWGRSPNAPARHDQTAERAWRRMTRTPSSSSSHQAPLPGALSFARASPVLSSQCAYLLLYYCLRLVEEKSNTGAPRVPRKWKHISSALESRIIHMYIGQGPRS